MRAEHRQIGAQLAAIHVKVAGGNVETEQEEQVLLALLGAHNMKEERVLYPSIDQMMTEEERDAVYRNMNQIPEERYRICCGVHQQ